MKKPPPKYVNPNKTSPLDSFYSDYAELIRLKGCRYSTVHDFTVVHNINLFREAKQLSIAYISKETGIWGLSSFLQLKSRLTACKVYKIAKVLNISMSELYVDRSHLTGEEPQFRFT